MSHGGDRYRNKVRLDFSVNTNPSGVFESVKQALSESIAKAEHYPDQEAQKLREELAKVLNVDPDWIIFGNGASEVLMAAVRAFQDRQRQWFEESDKRLEARTIERRLAV